MDRMQLIYAVLQKKTANLKNGYRSAKGAAMYRRIQNMTNDQLKNELKK